MDWVALMGCVVSLITALVGWIVGKYARRKTAIGNLMDTINDLSKQVSDYQNRIIDLQKEVLEVRKENAELKAGQERMTSKILELQRENAELKTIITKNK